MKSVPTPFRYEMSLRGDVVDVAYIGHMGEGELHHRTGLEALVEASAGSLGLLVRLDQLSGFHRSQVTGFGQLFLRHRKKLHGAALLGASPAAVFAAVTAGLMARMPTRGFARGEDEQALAWLAVQPRG